MRARGRSEGSLWRAAIPFALSCLIPCAAGAASTRVEELQARFPAVGARFSSEVRFEAVSWGSGSRVIEGFRAQLEDGAATPSSDRARVRFPALASEVFVAEGEGVRVVLAPARRAQRRAPKRKARPRLSRRLPRDGRLHVREARLDRGVPAPAQPPRATPFEYEIVEAAGATRVSSRTARSASSGRLRHAGSSSSRPSSWTRRAAAARPPRAGRWSAAHARRLTLDLDPDGLEYPLLVDPTWITTGSMSHGAGRRHRHPAPQRQGAGDGQRGRAPSSTTRPRASGRRPARAGRAAGFSAALLLSDGRVLACGGDQRRHVRPVPQVRPRHEHLEPASPA